MKKLIVLLMIIGILLSGCVSKTNDKTDNNDTGNDGKDGGESDVVEKIGINDDTTSEVSTVNNINAYND